MLNVTMADCKSKKWLGDIATTSHLATEICHLGGVKCASTVGSNECAPECYRQSRNAIIHPVVCPSFSLYCKQLMQKRTKGATVS